ncbi:MAG: GDSL-type esterase/lipase family protein [Campylobacterota bacterium]|nr:GDSL-type esterase/lipase family protein [Campylobacterota bacterium]
MELIFLGDSLTAYNNWNRFGPHYNGGIPGDTTDGLLYRLQHTLNKQPDTVVLMIGINDLLQGVPLSQVKSNYTLLIDSLEAVERLLILSNLPIARFDDRDELNAKVIALNIFLKSMVKERGLTYVDLYKHFTDGRGDLVDEYTSDGVHLSEAGYRVWEEQLTSYLI